jgi:hypothetical protein
VYVYMCAHACVLYVCVHAHVCCVCLLCLCVCVFVCMFVCVHVHVYVWLPSSNDLRLLDHCDPWSQLANTITDFLCPVTASTEAEMLSLDSTTSPIWDCVEIKRTCALRLHAPHEFLPVTCHTLGWLETLIYVWCIYGNFGREINKYTVIYGAYIWFWPTLARWFPCQIHRIYTIYIYIWFWQTLQMTHHWY